MDDLRKFLPEIRILTKNTGSMLISPTGKVFAWGAQYLKIDIYASHMNLRYPTRILPSASLQEPITAVASTIDGYMVLTVTGKIYAWGNICIYLQIKNYISRRDPYPLRLNEPATVISFGAAHLLVATASGKLYSGGIDNNGQLGQGASVRQSSLTLVPLPETVKTVVADECSSLAMTVSGHIYTWGDNWYNQLGLGHHYNQCYPDRFHFTADSIRVVNLKNKGGYLLTVSGQIYRWGKITLHVWTVPKKVEMGGPIRCLSLGPNGILAITVSGHWASPYFNRDEFLTDPIIMIESDQSNLVVTVSGKLYVWGANGDGQLGLGDSTDRNGPTLMPTFWEGNRDMEFE
jgi:alpha-tubulin suppressor-like RCC1 family protein